MIKISDYPFEGPLLFAESLRSQPGVYAILDEVGVNRYSILDVGESENVRARIAAHDRRWCWSNNSRGQIRYAVLYLIGSTATQRRLVESRIRAAFKPPCGVW